MRAPSAICSIHPEYLNTPRLAADAAGTTVWRWDQAEPFGNNPADEDPDGNSVAFDLPLRLPGQRHDAESGLHYNYYRDYDPGLGRYVESDPIGLLGGLNTSGYALQSPLSNVDPTGEATGAAAVVGGVALVCLRFPQQCATGVRVIGGALGGAIAYMFRESCPPAEDGEPKDYKKVREKCIKWCMHLLPSPTGDLQASEFHKCVSECLYDHGC